MDKYAERKLTERPPKEVTEFFRHVPPAFISDYLKKIGIKSTTMKDVHPIKLFEKYRQHIAGPAITMKFVPATEAYKYTEAPYRHTEIVEQGEKGDVIVIDGCGASYAFWGDHAAHQAIKQGLEAVVINGYTRDSTPIREIGFPVFCTGITHDSYVRRYDPVGYNVPIECAGAQVRPGDLIVADNDGVVVVPKELINDVAEGVKDTIRLEEELEVAVRNGRPWSEIYEDIHHRKYLPEK